MMVWSAYRCIYAEVKLEGAAYCINKGRWYSIDKDFVSAVESDYKDIQVSGRVFLPYRKSHTKEAQYSVDFVASDPTNLLLMDAKTIQHGGGHSKIELGDVLTSDNTFIHIKRYSSSAALSHLFNQAVVSTELVISDPDFRGKANKKIKEQSKKKQFQIKESDTKSITVILAILSDFQDEHPPIPFFSKIAIRYAQRRLQAFGCKVFIKNITREQD